MGMPPNLKGAATEAGGKHQSRGGVKSGVQEGALAGISPNCRDFGDIGSTGVEASARENGPFLTLKSKMGMCRHGQTQRIRP